MTNSKEIEKTKTSDQSHRSSRKRMEKNLNALEVKRKKEESVESLFSRLIIRPFSSIEPVKVSNTKVLFPMKAVKTIEDENKESIDLIENEDIVTAVEEKEIKDEAVKKAVESTEIKE